MTRGTAQQLSDDGRRPPFEFTAPMQELLTGRNFAVISTLDAAGQPAGSVTWVDTDGQHVLLNTAAGRAWPTRAQHDPRIAVTVIDAADPYRYLAVSGEVTEVREQGADTHIDQLAQRYLGLEHYPFRTPGERRVVLVVSPRRAVLAGGAR